jgi:hypothetical protein
LIRAFEGKRYYLDSDCIGYAWAETHERLVFRDDKGELIYTPEQKAQPIKPQSMSNADSCVPYTGDEHKFLVQLLPNNSTKTGLDSFNYTLKTTDESEDYANNK